MRHRMAALALDDNSAALGSAVLEAYSDALEGTDALVLELSPALGQA
jgi:hypothetical protein